MTDLVDFGPWLAVSRALWGLRFCLGRSGGPVRVLDPFKVSFASRVVLLVSAVQFLPEVVLRACLVASAPGGSPGMPFSPWAGLYSSDGQFDRLAFVIAHFCSALVNRFPHLVRGRFALGFGGNRGAPFVLATFPVFR